MRLIYYWNILLFVFLCACGAEVGERDNPFDGGADMTDYERDVYGWPGGTEGEIKEGNISSSCYVYENKTWRLGNEYDCSLGFGGCIAALQDSLRKNDFWYKCDTLMWRRASAIETDTAGWGDVKDGEVRIGRINDSIYYIYEKSKNAWRVATVFEFDTYDYANNRDWATGTDGDSKVGSVNANNCYVYENNSWRSGNTSDCLLGLRGCTALRQDTVGLGSDKVWHICDTKCWKNATTYEKDTFGWKNGTDGEIKKGNVTDSVYVFDKNLWRATSNVEGKLGGCVSAIADSVGKVGSTYYICKSGKWTTATVLEYDTYRWGAGKDGDCKLGSVDSKNCYVFEDKVWRSGNVGDCSLGLRGCTSLRQDTVGLGSDKVWHICDAKKWRNSTTYEKDTFGWKNGSDGEIKKGNVTDSVYVFDKTSWRVTSVVEGKLGGCVSAIVDSVGKVGSTYYICKSGKWTTATALEYDTYKWAAGKDGDSKSGSVNANNCYVYENKAWRSGNASDCSLGLRGCTSLRQDTVGLGADKVWHICDAKSWRNATTYEKDTFGWKDSTDGAIKKGYVTDTVYVFDKTTWRSTSAVEGKLGGCVSAIADSVGKVGSTYYICKLGKWTTATALEYDTYKWVVGKDGDSKLGSVNANNCYVYENKVWRRGDSNDCTLGLRGCTALRQDTVGFGSDNEWHTCDSKKWRTASTDEVDTYGWEAGAFDGEIRFGQVYTNLPYIYRKDRNVWTTPKWDEVETYDYENNCDWTAGEDGELRKGSVNGFIYVFDATEWRIADNIERVLGGCVASIKDSIGLVESVYYICSPRKWIEASVLQYDTYRQKCSTFGQIIHGTVYLDSTYFCYGNEWKQFYGNELTTYGKLIDSRDDQIYRTVKIGKRTWMAENLNYADSVNYPSMLQRNWCLGNRLQYCTKYGRLYTWSATVDSVYWAKQGKKCGDYQKACNLPEKVQGICPDGWHLPNYSEWMTLFDAVGSLKEATQKLKSRNGWHDYENQSGNGSDEYGFSVLPAGEMFKYSGTQYVGVSYSGLGTSSVFWLTSEIDTDLNEEIAHRVNTVSFSYHYDDSFPTIGGSGNHSKNSGFSVRCVKDEE